LVIIDYKGAKLFRYESNGKTSPYFNEINKIIEKYMDLYIDFDMYILDHPVTDPGSPSCRDKRIKNGFCVGYVTKYAYDYINGRNYDPSDMLRFANAIEKIYGPLTVGESDIEYGLFGNPNPNQGRNALIGGLGGALIGGAVTGSAGGALVGGLGGGLIGGLI
jgi:hypothetical protein